jgi:acyl carrier protein
LEKLLLEVVSEKTGYPAEMLEMGMDMEADLGIDSIKRVEIFGSLTQQYPEMEGINPNELTELRTLGEIVSYVSPNGTTPVASNKVSAPAMAKEIVNAPAAVEEMAAPVVQEVVNPVGDISQLEKILLEVVSEKTGYPAEMLEMGMDMEADLGIDSIKRVEIFGSLTQQYPEMEGINPNELTELRTLGEIVAFVAPKGAAAVANQAAPAPESSPEPVLEVSETPEILETATTKTNTAELEKMLLEVVSEKTGYPSEMLEMGMDLEADLGIDSIKRVEIFGSLTQKYPDMEGINPNELTELRTLGEIVTYVNDTSSKKVLA